MSLPTETDLQTLDYAFGGQPFAPQDPSAEGTLGLDWAFGGQPFVVAAASGGGGGGAANSGFFMFM